MWTARWILDNYDKGDETVRWDLFLAYPELRNYFEEVEGRPDAAVTRTRAPVVEKQRETWWSHCCKMVRG